MRRPARKQSAASVSGSGGGSCSLVIKDKQEDKPVSSDLPFLPFSRRSKLAGLSLAVVKAIKEPMAMSTEISKDKVASPLGK
jgi:hypothetical protein